jgi:hypothetical protein
MVELVRLQFSRFRWSVTPELLRDAHDHARAGVDFCVASRCRVAFEIALWMASHQVHAIALILVSILPIVLMRFYTISRCQHASRGSLR